jgi:DNA polymerase
MESPDLVRMVRQHVDSLRVAGIEWVPRPAGSTPPPGPSGASTPAVAAPAVAMRPPSPHKRQALDLLNENEVIGCTRCSQLVKSRTRTVFGVGNIEAELCFVGEAPGADEDAQGEPFVGAAGQLLNRIIAACKMKREEVYICNVLKCRPPGNRTPLPDEVANCRGYLDRQLDIIQPKFICALGAVASKALLNSELSIGRLRGRFHDYRGIQVLCTYHPAYLLRNPAAKKDVWEDMKKLMEAMGRPVG